MRILSLLTLILVCSCTFFNRVEKHLPEPEIHSTETKFDERIKGKWKLDYIIPVNGKEAKQLFKIQKPYLHFVDETKVAGNNGCNNVSGTYSSIANSIQFNTDRFASTRMHCEGFDESAFLGVLKTVNHFDLTEVGNKLILLNDDVVVMTLLRSVD